MSQVVVEHNQPENPYRMYTVRVRWEGRVVAGMSRIGPLRKTTSVTEYREGSGNGSIHKLPGVVRYEPITLERGVTQDREFDQWARASSDATPKTGFRRDVTFDLLSDTGKVEVTYRAYRCWVSEYQVDPRLDDTGAAVVIESITLVNEGWERVNDEISGYAHLLEPTTRITDLIAAGYPARLLNSAAELVKRNSRDTVAIILGGDVEAVGSAIAREAGVNLLRVDLGSIVSKYIDETERALDQVLERAEELGAALLFDEADALFGKRTGARSSHDRFANLEVSSLLERIDRHSGLVLIATTGDVTLDPEVLRRARLVMPGARRLAPRRQG